MLGPAPIAAAVKTMNAGRVQTAANGGGLSDGRLVGMA
jgi:hypothetical protein